MSEQERPRTEAPDERFRYALRTTVAGVLPNLARSLENAFDEALEAARTEGRQQGFMECARRALEAIRRDRDIPEGDPLLTILVPDDLSDLSSDGAREDTPIAAFSRGVAEGRQQAVREWMPIRKELYETLAGCHYYAGNGHKNADPTCSICRLLAPYIEEVNAPYEGGVAGL